MRMTQSQVRFRNEINDLAYQAVISLHRKKFKNKKKQFDFGILKKAGIPLIITVIAVAAYNLIPFSTSSGNAVYQENMQSSLGKEIASITTKSTIKNRRITVMFLFNKNNRRYAPMAKALIHELNRKQLIVDTAYPLDNRTVDEDAFGDLIDSAIGHLQQIDILMLISPGGVDFLEKNKSLAEYLDSGKKLIILGNCSYDSGFIELAHENKCVLISRKKGWLKSDRVKDYRTEKFVSEDYLLIGNI